MNIKHGVDLRGIQPQMAIAASIIESVYQSFHEELTITSGVEGKHMPTSLHYKGLAIDCRLPSTGSSNILAPALRLALGPQFDVVEEADHVHVEFDPKDAAPPVKA